MSFTFVPDNDAMHSTPWLGMSLNNGFTLLASYYNKLNVQLDFFYDNILCVKNGIELCVRCTASDCCAFYYMENGIRIEGRIVIKIDIKLWRK